MSDSNDSGEKKFRFKTGGFEIAVQIGIGVAILLVIHFCTSR